MVGFMFDATPLYARNQGLPTTSRTQDCSLPARTLQLPRKTPSYMVWFTAVSQYDMSKVKNTTTDEPTASETTSVPAAAEMAGPVESTEAGQPLSPEEIDALRATAELASQHWDRLVRVSADFDNFKKRAAREKQDAIKYAAEGVLSKLIPVLDNFEAALAAATPGEAAGLQSFKSGVAMIHQQFRNALAEAGVEEIEAAGKMFDPNVHEAVMEEESATAAEGQVLRQTRKGYKLRERLLRPASVIVARKPAA